MTTCQISNVLARKYLCTVSTPPWAKTWLVQGSKTSIHEEQNTFGAVPEMVTNIHSSK